MRLTLLFFLFISATEVTQHEKPELVCMKKNKSRNACYYNFKIDGAKYHFMDIGCRYTKSKVFKKIEEGTIALAKDWKVPC